MATATATMQARGCNGMDVDDDRTEDEAWVRMYVPPKCQRLVQKFLGYYYEQGRTHAPSPARDSLRGVRG